MAKSGCLGGQPSKSLAGGCCSTVTTGAKTRDKTQIVKVPRKKIRNLRSPEKTFFHDIHEWAGGSKKCNLAQSRCYEHKEPQNYGALIAMVEEMTGVDHAKFPKEKRGTLKVPVIATIPKDDWEGSGPASLTGWNKLTCQTGDCRGNVVEWMQICPKIDAKDKMCRLIVCTDDRKFLKENTKVEKKYKFDIK